MNHNPNQSMWPAPVEPPKQNLSIFAQSKNFPNTFPQNGPPIVSPLNLKNTSSSNSLPAFLAKSPTPPVNVFAQIINSKEKLNFDEPYNSQPSMSLTSATFTLNGQNSSELPPNGQASQNPSVNGFRPILTHPYHSSSSYLSPTFGSINSQGDPVPTQQIPRQQKSENLDTLKRSEKKLQHEATSAPIYNYIDKSQNRKHNLNLNLPKQNYQFGYLQEKPQLYGQMQENNEQNNGEKNKKTSLDPTSNKPASEPQELNIRQRQTSFGQILQQINALQGTQNPSQVEPVSRIEKIESISNQTKLSQIQNSQPKQSKDKPIQNEQQRKKEQKKLQSSLTQKIKKNPKKSQNKGETHLEVKPDLSKKANINLSTIRERSFEESAIEIKSQKDKKQMTDGSHSEGPSYMNQISSSHLSYMQNASSSKNSAPKQTNQFKMTSSHKLSSLDEQDHSLKKKQVEQERTNGLTKSESISKKNEVNVSAMTESQKITDKKLEQNKKEPSSQKKPKQIEMNSQKFQTDKKGSIFGRNSLKINFQKESEQIKIVKQTVKVKHAESQEEYDQNQEKDSAKNPNKKQTPKMESKNSPATGGQSSTIQSMRQNARHIRKSPLQANAKKQQGSSPAKSKELSSFSPVKQADNREKYQTKKQQKPIKQQVVLEVKPQKKAIHQTQKNSQRSDMEQNDIPARVNRKITFGSESDGIEVFSKQVLKEIMQQKPETKDKLTDKREQKKVQTKPDTLFKKSSKIQGHIQPAMPQIIEENHSLQQSPQRQKSPGNLQKVEQFSLSLMLYRLRSKYNQQISEQFSLKLMPISAQALSIKIQLENIFDLIQQLKVIYGQEAQSYAKKADKIKQTVFQLQASNVLLPKLFFQNFTTLHQTAKYMMQFQYYLSQQDLILKKDISEPSTRDAPAQQILQTAQRLSERIPLKLAQIASILENYQAELTLEKTLEFENQQKQPLKQAKNSFFSLLNLIPNKYCWKKGKKQSEDQKPKPKSNKDFKSYANVKNNLLGIMKDKNSNLIKLQEKVKNCLKQSKAVQLNLVSKVRGKSSERKLELQGRKITKFEKIILQRQERQKRLASREISNSKNEPFNLFWIRLFQIQNKQLYRQKDIQWRRQMRQSLIQKLDIGPAYKYQPKQHDKRGTMEKNHAEKYNQRYDIMQKYRKLRQVYNQQEQNLSMGRQKTDLLGLLKQHDELEEERIADKVRLNQQMILKAKNVSVRLKNSNFRLVTFISQHLINAE